MRCLSDHTPEDQESPDLEALSDSRWNARSGPRWKGIENPIGARPSRETAQPQPKVSLRYEGSDRDEPAPLDVLDLGGEDPALERDQPRQLVVLAVDAIDHHLDTFLKGNLIMNIENWLHTGCGLVLSELGHP